MSGKERRRRTSLELLFDIDGAGGRAKKSRFGTPSKKGGDDKNTGVITSTAGLLLSMEDGYLFCRSMVALAEQK